MMAAMQYAGLIGLLALIAVTPSYAQSRTAMPDGHPSHYCLPTTVDSSDEQKVYCEGWRAFRKGWCLVGSSKGLFAPEGMAQKRVGGSSGRLCHKGSRPGQGW